MRYGRQLLAGCASGSMLALLASCNQASAPVAAAPAPAATPYKVVASVQDIMEGVVDPSADGVWDSVGASISVHGVEDRRPRTDEEWKQVRLRAVTLIEGANLLMMEGRSIAPAGGKIADEGFEGVLTTAQADEKLKAEHATFVQLASSLNDTGKRMLEAIDARQPDKMLEIGEEMDEACESCHVHFWYPNQPAWKITQGRVPRYSP